MNDVCAGVAWRPYIYIYIYNRQHSHISRLLARWLLLYAWPRYFGSKAKQARANAKNTHTNESKREKKKRNPPNMHRRDVAVADSVDWEQKHLSPSKYRSVNIELLRMDFFIWLFRVCLCVSLCVCVCVRLLTQWLAFCCFPTRIAGTFLPQSNLELNAMYDERESQAILTVLRIYVFGHCFWLFFLQFCFVSIFVECSRCHSRSLALTISIATVWSQCRMWLPSQVPNTTWFWIVFLVAARVAEHSQSQ